MTSGSPPPPPTGSRHHNTWQRGGHSRRSRGGSTGSGDNTRGSSGPHLWRQRSPPRHGRRYRGFRGGGRGSYHPRYGQSWQNRSSPSSPRDTRWGPSFKSQFGMQGGSHPRQGPSLQSQGRDAPNRRDLPPQGLGGNTGRRDSRDGPPLLGPKRRPYTPPRWNSGDRRGAPPPPPPPNISAHIHPSRQHLHAPIPLRPGPSSGVGRGSGSFYGPHRDSRPNTHGPRAHPGLSMALGGPMNRRNRIRSPLRSPPPNHQRRPREIVSPRGAPSGGLSRSVFGAGEGHRGWKDGDSFPKDRGWNDYDCPGPASSAPTSVAPLGDLRNTLSRNSAEKRRDDFRSGLRRSSSSPIQPLPMRDLPKESNAPSISPDSRSHINSSSVFGTNRKFDLDVHNRVENGIQERKHVIARKDDGARPPFRRFSPRDESWTDVRERDYSPMRMNNFSPCEAPSKVETEQHHKSPTTESNVNSIDHKQRVQQAKTSCSVSPKIDSGKCNVAFVSEVKKRSMEKPKRLEVQVQQQQDNIVAASPSKSISEGLENTPRLPDRSDSTAPSKPAIGKPKNSPPPQQHVGNNDITASKPVMGKPHKDGSTRLSKAFAKKRDGDDTAAVSKVVSVESEKGGTTPLTKVPSWKPDEDDTTALSQATIQEFGFPHPSRQPDKCDAPIPLKATIEKRGLSPVLQVNELASDTQQQVWDREDSTGTTVKLVADDRVAALVRESNNQSPKDEQITPRQEHRDNPNSVSLSKPVIEEHETAPVSELNRQSAEREITAEIGVKCQSLQDETTCTFEISRKSPERETTAPKFTYESPGRQQSVQQNDRNDSTPPGCDAPRWDSPSQSEASKDSREYRPESSMDVSKTPRLSAERPNSLKKKRLHKYLSSLHETDLKSHDVEDSIQPASSPTDVVKVENENIALVCEETESLNANVNIHGPKPAPVAAESCDVICVEKVDGPKESPSRVVNQSKSSKESPVLSSSDIMKVVKTPGSKNSIESTSDKKESVIMDRSSECPVPLPKLGSPKCKPLQLKPSQDVKDHSTRSEYEKNAKEKTEVILPRISSLEMKMNAVVNRVEVIKSRMQRKRAIATEQLAHLDESEPIKSARALCYKVVKEIERRDRDTSILEDPMRRFYPPHDHLVQILNQNRADSQFASYELSRLCHKPELGLYHRLENGDLIKIDDDPSLLKKIGDSIRRVKEERKTHQKLLGKEYRSLKRRWLQKQKSIRDKRSKEKREVARDRDRFLLVHTRGTSAAMTCKTSSGRTSTKVLPHVTPSGTLTNVAEIDAMLTEIEQCGGTPGSREIWQRTLADIPEQNSSCVPFDSNNLLIHNPVAEWHSARMANFWTREERLVFLTKYLSYQKNFKKIATFLPNKGTNDCAQFYFSHKLEYNLKQLLRDSPSMKRKGIRERHLLQLVGLDMTEQNLALCGVDASVCGGIPSENNSGNDFVPSSTGGLMRSIAQRKRMDREFGRKSLQSANLSANERQLFCEALVSYGMNWKLIADQYPSLGRAPLVLQGYFERMKDEHDFMHHVRKYERRTSTLKVETQNIIDQARSPRMDKFSSEGIASSPRPSRSADGSPGNAAEDKKAAVWSQEERKKAQLMFREYGKEYKLIATKLGSKTPAQVKGYWKHLRGSRESKGKKQRREKGERRGAWDGTRESRKRDAQEAELGDYGGGSSSKREKYTSRETRESHGANSKGGSSSSRKDHSARRNEDNVT